MYDILKTKQITLSQIASNDYSLDKITPQDFESIRLWRNAQLSILRQNTSLAKIEQETYWKNQLNLSFSDSKTLCFVYKEKNKTIGYGGLVHIDFESASAELSTLLDPIFCEPSPLFLNTTSIFIDLSFKLAIEMGIKELRAEVFDHRVDILRLFYKKGFQITHYTQNTKECMGFSYGSWHMKTDLLV